MMRHGAWVVATLLLLSALVLRASAEVQGWSIWGWVALTPLFVAIRAYPAHRAALAGAWWGFISSISRVLFTAEGGASSAADLLAPTIIVALYAATASALIRRIGSAPLLLAIGWLAVEMLLSGFGWHAGLLEAAVTLSVDGAWASPFAGALVAALAMILVSVIVGDVIVVVHCWAKRGEVRRLIGRARPRLLTAPEVSGALVMTCLCSWSSRGPPSVTTTSLPVC